ncbi:MAG: bifunctional adenosylcobinamide kinase/adenosylcobinamide-phosphate guanylyltransferase [Oscillospiraceae bacterium]|nr:bifunctional adenosylcobinamide kinase/adenosylcobinamide-phosphate guanylyltransferase [Oscillospiraceae bacterium]
MIFVTGPLFAGKRDCVRRLCGLTEEEFKACAVWDAQELVPCEDLTALAEELSQNRIVIATETGGGLIPMDPAERRRREDAGRLACLLAERAETVIRVCCGLPQLLKGEWP